MKELQTANENKQRELEAMRTVSRLHSPPITMSSLFCYKQVYLAMHYDFNNLLN